MGTARCMLGVMMPWVMMLLLARATSSPSMIVGMGVFRHIWRWWTRGVARTTLGDVASIDVVASPTTRLASAHPRFLVVLQDRC